MESSTIIEAGILTGLGIQGIHPDFPQTWDSSPADSRSSVTDTVNGQNGWQLFKQKHSLTNLWKLFQNIKVISFCEWARLPNGTDTWDGFLSEVIRPIAGSDRQFIFQLGDVCSRKFFEVDEILDIISDFSLHGRVSMVLDKLEADCLSAILNGKRELTQESGNDIRFDNRYAFIFHTMHIDQLLVSVDDSIIVYQSNRQFIVAGNPAIGKQAAIQAAVHL